MSNDATAPATMRTMHCGAVTTADVGRRITLCGWVAKRREHGEHLAFIDLRDHTGIMQCVVAVSYTHLTLPTILRV